MSKMTKKQRERFKRLLPDGTPRYARVYDEKSGKFADRYTVVFTGQVRSKCGGQTPVLAMSGAPYHPQGIGLHNTYPYIIDVDDYGYPPKMGRKNHLGTRVPFSELPEDCRVVVLDDYSDYWDLPKEDVFMAAGLAGNGYAKRLVNFPEKRA